MRFAFLTISRGIVPYIVGYRSLRVLCDLIVWLKSGPSDCLVSARVCAE